MSRTTRHALAISATLGLALLTAGCADRPAPTASASAPVGPRFTFTNGPQSPGPLIFRTSEGAGVFGFAERDLTAVVGLVTPVADLCSGAEEIVTLFDAQSLVTPAGGLRELGLGVGLPVVVYDEPISAGPGDGSFDLCALADAPILATGTVRFAANVAFAPDGSGHFQWRAAGPVTYTSGGSGRFSGHTQLVFDAGGALARVTSRFTLTPPRG